MKADIICALTEGINSLETHGKDTKISYIVGRQLKFMQHNFLHYYSTRGSHVQLYASRHKRNFSFHIRRVHQTHREAAVSQIFFFLPKKSCFSALKVSGRHAFHCQNSGIVID
jgi:hypothetical protein